MVVLIYYCQFISDTSLHKEKICNEGYYPGFVRVSQYF